MISDDHLIEKMAEGDEAAFETLVRRYHVPLQIFAERMLLDPKRAEDVVQETFFRLIKQLQAGKQPIQVRPWLYKVSGNLCRDMFRRSSYKQEQMVDSVGEQIIAAESQSAVSVLQLVEHQETRKELMKTLDELTDSQREIVILRFYHDLKLEEIAATTGHSLSAVKSHLYAGLKSLKKRLLRDPQFMNDTSQKRNLKNKKESAVHGTK